MKLLMPDVFTVFLNKDVDDDDDDDDDLGVWLLPPPPPPDWMGY